MDQHVHVVAEGVHQVGLVLVAQARQPPHRAVPLAGQGPVSHRQPIGQPIAVVAEGAQLHLEAAGR
jgi:hypothetical protein